MIAMHDAAGSASAASTAASDYLLHQSLTLPFFSLKPFEIAGLKTEPNAERTKICKPGHVAVKIILDLLTQYRYLCW